MNNNNIFQSVRKGFQITVGATASVVETLQDSQKRSAAFTEIQSELEQKNEYRRENNCTPSGVLNSYTILNL